MGGATATSAMGGATGATGASIVGGATDATGTTGSTGAAGAEAAGCAMGWMPQSKGRLALPPTETYYYVSKKEVLRQKTNLGKAKWPPGVSMTLKGEEKARRVPYA